MRKIEIRSDRGAADESAIAAFERAMAIRLPAAYRRLLLAHDAPRLEREEFCFIERTCGQFTTRDVAFFGFGAAVPPRERIVAAQDCGGAWPGRVVAFGRCARGDLVCFDYRRDPGTDDPRVVVLHHDRPDDAGRLVASLVADSFDQFLDLLRRASA